VRRIVLVTFPDATLLDLVGPAEVFTGANRAHRGAERYELVVASATGGSVTASSGIAVDTLPLATVGGPVDTLMVVGGFGVDAAVGDAALREGIRRLAPLSRRLTSVCSGALLLADLGLLDGRRVTTHWARGEALARRYPDVRVDADRIYVRDGNVWTSAGVTAGMDLALALVEDDTSAAVAREVARWLVLFAQRPGGQAQFSTHLALPTSQRADVRAVLDIIAAEPAADLSVAALARRVGLSDRHLARCFRAETGTTVAAHVERSRIEEARRRLEASDAGTDAIARACGFGTVETFHRAFKRRTGITPGEHRARFA
jgi:transcriptional regulator GlxA family with amidase domain